MDEGVALAVGKRTEKNERLVAHTIGAHRGPEPSQPDSTPFPRFMLAAIPVDWTIPQGVASETASTGLLRIACREEIRSLEAGPGFPAASGRLGNRMMS